MGEAELVLHGGILKGRSSELVILRRCGMGLALA